MIDTNILLDWLLDREPARTKRIDALFAKLSEVHIPDVVLIEFVFVLEKVYGFPRDIINQNVQKVLDMPNFNCSQVLFHGALADYIEHPAWSFVDCCLLQYARLQHVQTVWTFDKKLVSQSDNRARLPD